MPVLIADTHIHPFRDCAGPPDPETGLNARLLDGVRVLRRAFDEAARRDKRLIHLGDVLHLKQGAPNEARNLVRQVFKAGKAAGVESMVVLGNHDRTRDGRDAEAVGDLEEYAEIVREPVSFPLRGEVFFPWLHDGVRRAEALEWVQKDVKEGRGPWTFYSHLQIAGAVYPSGFSGLTGVDVALADLRPERFTAMFFGHVHKRQRLGGAGVDRHEKSAGWDRDMTEDAGGPSSRAAGSDGYRRGGAPALAVGSTLQRCADPKVAKPRRASSRVSAPSNYWYLGAALPANWGEEGDAYGFTFWDPARGKLEWFDGGAPRFVVAAWPKANELGLVFKGHFVRMLCRPGQEDEARAWANSHAPRWLEVIPISEEQEPERRVEGLTLDLSHEAMVERYAEARWTAKAPTLAEVVAAGKGLLHG